MLCWDAPPPPPPPIIVDLVGIYIFKDNEGTISHYHPISITTICYHVWQKYPVIHKKHPNTTIDKMTVASITCYCGSGFPHNGPAMRKVFPCRGVVMSMPWLWSLLSVMLRGYRYVPNLDKRLMNTCSPDGEFRQVHEKYSSAKISCNNLITTLHHTFHSIL